MIRIFNAGLNDKTLLAFLIYTSAARSLRVTGATDWCTVTIQQPEDLHTWKHVLPRRMPRSEVGKSFQNRGMLKSSVFEKKKTINNNPSWVFDGLKSAWHLS